MSQALAQTSAPPGLGLALSSMAGLAIVGGMAGAMLTVNKPNRAWLYGGIGTGVAAGGLVGFYTGRFLMARAIAKLEAQAETDKDQAAG